MQRVRAKIKSTERYFCFCFALHSGSKKPRWALKPFFSSPDHFYLRFYSFFAVECLNKRAIILTRSPISLPGCSKRPLARNTLRGYAAYVYAISFLPLLFSFSFAILVHSAAFFFFSFYLSAALATVRARENNTRENKTEAECLLLGIAEQGCLRIYAAKGRPLLCFRLLQFNSPSYTNLLGKKHQTRISFAARVEPCSSLCSLISSN